MAGARVPKGPLACLLAALGLATVQAEVPAFADEPVPVRPTLVHFYENREASDRKAINHKASPCWHPLVRTFAVPDAFPVGDVSVAMRIRHSWRGDLQIRLVAPDGRGVLLASGAGGGAVNLRAVFDDEAQLAVRRHLVPDDPEAGSDPARYRRLQPQEPLSRLDGIDARGAWQLQICDLAPQSSGGFLDARLALAEKVGLGRTASPASEAVARKVVSVELVPSDPVAAAGIPPGIGAMPRLLTRSSSTAAGLDVVISTAVVSDPVNNDVNPKFIPGAILQVCVLLRNRSAFALSELAVEQPDADGLERIAGGIGMARSCGEPQAGWSMASYSTGDGELVAHVPELAAGKEIALLYLVRLR